MGKKESDSNKQPSIHLDVDGYRIQIINGKLVIESPIAVEVKDAPHIDNGVDRLVPEPDLQAAAAQKPDMKRWIKGRYYKHQGVYLGDYRLKHPEDSNLSRHFHVFAAKQDFPHCLDNQSGFLSAHHTYEFSHLSNRLAGMSRAQHDTIENNSGLRKVGDAIVKFAPVPRIDGRAVMEMRDGLDYKWIKSGLWEAIDSGNYKGQWFIPTAELLEDYVYPNIGKRDLKGSFCQAARDGGQAHIYMSSSFDEGQSAYKSFDFAKGDVCTLEEGNRLASARLVRLVPVA